MQKWPDEDNSKGPWKLKSDDNALAPYFNGKMKDNLITVQEMAVENRRPDRRVVINVGGHRHETWLGTLDMIPGNRLATLAQLQEEDESYDVNTNEYFFDRDPRAFGVIIQFYRSGELHVDQSLCGNVLKRELHFWGIEEQDIEACCWTEYSKFTEHLDALRDLDENFTATQEDATFEKKTRGEKFKTLTWKFLEDPGSSIFAKPGYRGLGICSKIYAVVSMFFVALSITIFVLETHKLFQIDSNSGRPMNEVSPDDDDTPTGGARSCCCESENTTRLANINPVPQPVLKVLDYICAGFFLIEIIVRFSFAPDKIRFWKDALNIIDLVCLIPHITAIILAVVTNGKVAGILKVFMVFRVVRVLRIFKLMKHYSAFKILVYTIKVSTKELLLMIVFLMSGVLMFASLIHYVEKENFPNIPIAIWWAIVTMTTVGYGDKYPVNYGGYGIGCLCVICGVLVIAFTVPIVVNNFSLYYQHAQTRIKLPGKKKRTHVPAHTRSRSNPSSRPSCSSLESTKTQESGVSNEPAPRPPSKQKTVTSHIHKVAPERRKASPVEATPVESEKFAEELQAQSKKLMDSLHDADEKRENERKRQKFMLKMKKDQRVQSQTDKKKKAKEIDGKASDDKEFVNKS